MTGGATQPLRLSFLAFAAVLLITWFCYQPSLSGDFTLDDTAHLADLAIVQDFSSGVDYVLIGSNSPTGRPIAMATFALQATDYAAGAEPFLQVNVLIHLVNGVLLLWFLFELGRAYGMPPDRAAVVGVTAASIWMLLALNATATMLVIQRMTTLSATFTLTGMAGYLVLRRRTDLAIHHALVAKTLLIGTATVLATLTKEIGILLPAYLLVLESTVLQRPAHIGDTTWRRWRVVVLGLPTVAVVAYLASSTVYPEWMVARRGFDGWERFLTETRVLWIYLGKALYGLSSHLGIYQSETAIARSVFAPTVLLSLVSWLALTMIAVLYRRRYPFLALAILWLLAGHLLESTVLPLEVYFEHRNYLPIVGPLFALCAVLLRAERRTARLSLVGLAVLALVNAGFLYTFASIWGEPSTSARYWAHRYPDSVRAVTNLATHQLTDEGPTRTVRTLHDFVAEHPQHGYLLIQALNLRCLIGATGDEAKTLSDIEVVLPSVDFTYTAGNMLSDLFSTTTRIDCGVLASDVRQLAEALLTNPRYGPDPYYNQFHHKLLAGIARYEGNMAEALGHLETALSFWATPELNAMMVTGLVAQGDYERAEAFVDEALLRTPSNPLKAFAWRRDLESLRQYIFEVAKRADGGEHDGNE